MKDQGNPGLFLFLHSHSTGPVANNYIGNWLGLHVKMVTGTINAIDQTTDPLIYH